MRGFIKAATLAVVGVVALGGASVVPTGAAMAQRFEFDVGGGPRYYHRDRDDDWRWRRHHWRAEEFGGCRTVIRRIWRDGERIIVRRRVCD